MQGVLCMALGLDFGITKNAICRWYTGNRVKTVFFYIIRWKNVFQNDSGLPGAGSSNFKDPGHRSVSTNERLSSTPRLPNSLTMKNFLKDDDACTECGGAGDGIGQPFAEQTSS